MFDLFHLKELNNDASDTVLDTEMRLYLIGDLKFLFTMMRRDGYSGAWCIYCELKQSQSGPQYTEIMTMGIVTAKPTSGQSKSYMALQ